MTEVNETPQSTPQEPTETHNDAEAKEKMANLDKMIEEFKLNNPSKKSKKPYKSIF